MRRAWFAAAVVLTFACRASAADPAPTTSQCLASNEHSISLEKSRHLEAARNEAVSCAAASCPAAVREECSRRASRLVDALPTIVFEVKDQSGNDVPTAVVRVDDDADSHAIDGSAIAIDPGGHTFAFEASGMRSTKKELVLREGEKNRRERIVLAPTESSFTPPPPEPPKRNTFARNLGLGLAGLGIVSVGVGAFFGLRANGQWSNAQNECVAGQCSPTGHDAAVRDHDEAMTSALVSTIAFAGGGALIAGGAVLVFATPVVTPKSASVAVGARF